MAHLLIQNGSSAPTVHQLNGAPVTIGRSPENTIVLEDSAISSRHAEITPDGEKWKLRDLQSSNGTTVNGQAVTEQELHEGDVIRIGSVECRFTAATPEKKREEPPPTSERPPSQKVSIRERLNQLARMVVRESKRAAGLAALKAKIEKLKFVDLNAAHLALGLKCLEHQLCKEQLSMHYAEIEAIDGSIAGLRSRSPEGHSERRMATIAKHASNAKKWAEVELLERKRRSIVTKLGERAVNEESVARVAGDEVSDIRRLADEVYNLDHQYELVRQADRSAQPSSVKARLVAIALAALVVAGSTLWIYHRRAPDPNLTGMVVESKLPDNASDEDKANAKRTGIAEELVKFASEPFVDPKLPRGTDPSYQDTISFIINKTDHDGVQREMGIGKTSHLLIMRDLRRDHSPSMVVVVDPTHLSTDVKVFSGDGRKASVKVSCTNGASDLIAYRSVFLSKNQSNYVGLSCADVADAGQVATAFTHLITILGGRADSF